MRDPKQDAPIFIIIVIIFILIALIGGHDEKLKYGAPSPLPIELMYDGQF